MNKKIKRKLFSVPLIIITLVALIITPLNALPVIAAAAPVVNTDNATNVRFNTATLNGNLFDLGTAETVNLYFQYAPDEYYFVHDDYNNVTPVQTTSNPGIFSADLNGLSPGKTYHFRAVAEGESTDNGTDVTFTTPTMAPVVSTLEASAITRNNAVLNGNLIEPGTAPPVDLYFEYGTSTVYGSLPLYVKTTSDSGKFSYNLNEKGYSLNPGTIYHYRAIAENGHGISYGLDKTFTTASIPIIVETLPAENVTVSTANLKGILRSLSISDSVDVSFEYGPTIAYGLTTPAQTFTESGPFNADISGLIPGTTYHFRAKAESETEGTAYGIDITFPTSIQPPEVTSGSPNAVSYTGATLNGVLDSLGTASAVNVFFEYGETSNYGSSTAAQELTAAGDFSADLSGLNPETLYHFRARVDGGIHGATYGADLTFATLAVMAPTVTNIGSTNVSYDNGTLTGRLESLGTAPAVDVSFEYGTTLDFGSATPVQTLIAPDNFSFFISGLTPATTYYYKVRASGGIHGVSYVDNLTFKTLEVIAPTVTTSGPTVVWYDNGTLTGRLESLGTAPVVEVSFEYGTTLDFGSRTPVLRMTAPDNFSLNVSGLIPATVYYFRAQADGIKHGTGYGDNLTFTTLIATPPEVGTVSAIDIKSDTATFNGRLVSPGTSGSVQVSFGYGTADADEFVTGTRTLTAADNFSFTLTGLLPATTYHFQARADGGVHGMAYGLDLTFTTLSAPRVNTGVATNIRLNTAVLNGTLLDMGSTLSDNVSFRYAPESYFITHNNTYSNVTPILTMFEPGNFSTEVGGLIPGTTYHFSAVAEGEGIAYGQDMTFSTHTMSPVASTAAATNISRTSATLNGYLIEIGTAPSVSVSFDFGATTGYELPPPGLHDMSSPGPFSATVSNLSPGATYHFRAYVIDGENIIRGVDMTFTTPSIPVVVETNPASSITTSTTSLNGKLCSLGTAATVNISFEYGTTPAYGSVTPVQIMTAEGSFQAAISDLKPGTTYHFRALADGGTTGGAEGVDMIFTTLTSPPDVTTQSSTSIDFTTATLTGSLDSMGTAEMVDVFFEYGETTNYGKTTTIQSLTAGGAFYATLSDLKDNTTYHFRTKADGGIHGAAYGLDMEFTTRSVNGPVVTSFAASGISYDLATLNGHLDKLGTAGKVKVRFEYGKTLAYGHSTPLQELTAEGNFNYNLSGLDTDAQYYFRAKADGDFHGTAYGDNLTFSTLKTTAPDVTTIAASSVSYDSVTLNGHLDSLGTAGTVEVFFKYGRTTDYDNETTKRALINPDNFSFYLDKLTPGKSYYFRAWADGDFHGTAYGDNLTFTTLEETKPTVTTAPASSIGYDNVTLNGHLDSLGTAGTVEVFFKYGETTDYGKETTKRAQVNQDNFSFYIDNLLPGTTYHFIAWADSGIHGFDNGTDMTFSTLGVTGPEITTLPAANIDFNRATLNGHLDLTGTASKIKVFFEYGPTTSYGSSTAIQTLKISDNFTCDALNLLPGTTYHFRAWADGGIHGFDTGTDMTFTTLSPPTVNTVLASNITHNSAVLNGNLSSLGTASAVSVFFEYGKDNKYGSATPIQTLTSSGTGAFKFSLGGCSPNTVYHFRAVAYGGLNGTSYGADMTFTTLTPPAASTHDASGVTLNAAILNGHLDSPGTATTVKVYFEYGMTTSYGNSTPVQFMTLQGAVSANLIDLNPGTTYHFRIKVDGDVNGSVEGADKTFNTLSIAPNVSTAPADNITFSGATLSGNLGSTGTAASLKVSFEYGPTTSYGSRSDIQTLTAAGLFSIHLSGLSPGTTYHYRAKADGESQGVSFGVDMTFTTLVEPPQVSTMPAGEISSEAVTLNGNLTSLGTAGIVNVYFDYGMTTGYGNTTAALEMTGAGKFYIIPTGLSPGTIYHFRAVADGGIHGIVFGQDMAFTTANSGTIPPAADTLEASSIGYNSATLNGNLRFMGTAGTVNVYFRYGTTDSYDNVSPIQPLNAEGLFTAGISGLNPGTTYHFRVEADGGVNGTAAGSDLIFTTITVPPEVTTLAAESISANSATLKGDLISLGTSSTIDVSFEYGTTTLYGSSSSAQALTVPARFAINLSGLTAGTTYHFRAKANGGTQGTGTGPDMTFTTANSGSMPPSVVTSPASSVTANSAVFNGNLLSSGTAGLVYVSFEYGLTIDYGNVTSLQPIAAAGPFSAPITGLTPDTVYHFRVKADGGVMGSSVGDDLTFTTLTLPPSASTLEASLIASTSAVLNGNLSSMGSAGTVNVFFEYGTTTTYDNVTAIQELAAAGAFNASISNLIPGTTYHFRARADGGKHGLANGLDKTFTTANSGTTPPQAETAAASSIGSNSASLNATVSSLGSAGTVNVYFDYGPTDAYGFTTSIKTLKSPGICKITAKGLTAETSYHFRVKVDGDVNGTAAGADMTFTTKKASSGGSGGGGGGGGGSRKPQTPSFLDGTGSLDVSSIISKDGVCTVPVTLRSQDGKAILRIPEGTLSDKPDGKLIQLLTVSQVENSTLPPSPEGYNIISRGYNFEPSGASFNPFASLTIQFDPAGLEPGSEVLLSYYDEAENSWTDLPVFSDDNDTITSHLRHFTTFAVMEKLAEVPIVTPTPSPTPTPTPAPTSTPSISPVPGPSPTPTIPKPSPTTPDKPKTIGWGWIIIIAGLVILLTCAVVFLIVRRRRKSTKGAGFTTVPGAGTPEKVPGEAGQDDSSNSTLYSGRINLVIRPPVVSSQIRALEKCLRETDGLKIEMIGGSSNESNITISIAKDKPIALLYFLRKMAPVKQVIAKVNQIEIVLNPPAEA